MTAPDLQVLAQVVAGRLLNTAAEGIVLAFLVWVLLRLIGQQNSGTRFAVWFSVLLAIVALPLLAGSDLGATRPSALSMADLRREIVLSSSWALYLSAAWGVGAGLSLLRLGIGLWRVRQIRKNCSEVDVASLDPAIVEAFRDPGPHRLVKLCVSNDVAIPAAIGFFRPLIVFPAMLLPQLSVGEVKAILLHELAHLRRWDDWTNLAQKIVKAVFFFHPAVWWIENHLTLEREMACDDIVLAQTPSPRDYASSLISFAEKLQNARSLALAQALVSRMRHMSLRVAQILDAKRPCSTLLWKPVLCLSAAMLAFAFGAAPYVPRLVAFQTQPKESHTQQLQATGQSKTYGTHSDCSAAVDLNHCIAPPVAQSPGVALEPRAVLVDFNTRTASARILKTTSPRTPATMRVTTLQRERPMQETLVILQSTRFDGSGVWTLCVWKVRGEISAEKQLDSTIVLDSL